MGDQLLDDVEDYLRSQPPWRKPRAVLSLLLVLLIVAAAGILGVIVATGGIWSVASGFTYLSAHGMRHLAFDGTDMARLALADVCALGACWLLAYAVKRRMGDVPLLGTILGCLIFGVLVAFWVGQIDMEDAGWENYELIRQEQAKAVIRSLISMAPVFAGLFIGISRAGRDNRIEARRILNIDIALLEARLGQLLDTADEADDLLNSDPDEQEDAGYLKARQDLERLYQQRDAI